MKTLKLPAKRTVQIRICGVLYTIHYNRKGKVKDITYLGDDWNLTYLTKKEFKRILRKELR